MNINWNEIIPAVRMALSNDHTLLARLVCEGDDCSYGTVKDLIEAGFAENSNDAVILSKEDREPEQIKRVLSGNKEAVKFILFPDTGLVELYSSGRVVLITGGAQGFGAGIAEKMFGQGYNIIIADLKEAAGNELTELLNARGRQNRAIFIKTDVSDHLSVRNMVDSAVRQFGGIDVLISNAGILRAGGLDEMDIQTFELMTRVNYTGYFNCVKYVSEIMKIQSAVKEDYYMDIIQINSKSGLRGSNKNFTYAGGKFGGIGLTQSFALELITNNIKVNSICPGNFFEGPLWADPVNGLFKQYLDTGKVPGAKSIDDVRAFYEKQVPAGRGCRVEDVLKAINYVIDQEYETGQAIPVTGGQIMLK